MSVTKIIDGKGGSFIINNMPDVERVNPVDYYRRAFIMSNFFVTRELMRIYKLPFVSNLIDKVCSRKAIEEWQKHYDVAIKVEIPENLKSIFDTKKKNEQINLLKGLSLTPDILFSFIIYAWNEQGYSFSQFHIEHQHKGVKKEELPTVIHIKDGDVETVGETPLTKGQQKQVVENRKVVVAKIFDKGDEWHCFFVTYDSLKGKEPWKNGQPHFHYISDKFGIKRNEVIKRLKDRKYNLGSLPHIDLND